MILNDTVTAGDPLEIAKEYVTEEVPTPEDAIQGASDIVAEIVSDSADFRAYLRKKMWNEGFIQAELTGDEEVQQQFLQYAEYAEPVRQMPSHRILALTVVKNQGFEISPYCTRWYLCCLHGAKVREKSKIHLRRL